MTDQRWLFIQLLVEQRLSMADACRAVGISRVTGYECLHRYQTEGRAGLTDRSRAPHHSPQSIDPLRAQVISACREHHPTWGARKIQAYLQQQNPDQVWPAPSTIGDLLKRNGQIRSRRYRSRPAPVPLTPIQEANQVWCIDFKGQFRLANQHLCYPLTLTDGASRFLLRCQARPNTRWDGVRPVLVAAFHEFGLPQVLRSDNGAPFASQAIGGLSAMAVWLLKLGIHPERIAPGHPEQNGRHERMHRTLKEETTLPAAANLRAQQARFDQFRQLYNEQRPHEALGQKPPATGYAPSLRPYPLRLPELVYPSGLLLKTVRPNGCFRWAGTEVFLSEVLRGERIGLDALSEELYAVYVGPLALTVFDARARTFYPPKKAARWLRRLDPQNPEPAPNQGSPV